MSGDIATVNRYPLCDFCQLAGRQEDARYDGKTRWGAWANMCTEHFGVHGVGLGTGRGQRLVVTK
jgi:hypothetical protein